MLQNRTFEALIIKRLLKILVKNFNKRIEKRLQKRHYSTFNNSVLLVREIFYVALNLHH